MPISREQKEAVVARLTDYFGRFESAVLVDHGGLTVAQMQQIRRRLRDAGSPYLVAKNRLIKLAMANRGLTSAGLGGEDMGHLLTGMTSVAFGFEQPNLPAKMLLEMTSEFPNLGLKGGFFGRALVEGEDGVKRIAAMRSKDDALGELLWLINPANALRPVVNILSGGPRRIQLVAGATPRVLQQLKTLKEQESAAA